MSASNRSCPGSILRRTVASRPFLIASGVLLGATLLWNASKHALGLVFIKQRVELLRPLEELPDRYPVDRPGPRFVLARNHPLLPQIPDGKEKLKSDVEESLGTKQYISWYFLDTVASSEHRPVFVRLHVAYYTGLRDAVPHVADACMVAGGAVPDGAPDEVRWSVPGAEQVWQDVSVRRAAFVRQMRDGPALRTVVFYVFNVNGLPLNDRLLVRARLIDPRMKYCYYAKIELTALGADLSDEQSEETCRTFFAAAAGQVLRSMASADDVRRLEHGG